MRRTAIFIALLCIPLTSCMKQTLQWRLNVFNISDSNTMMQEDHGVAISVKSCSLNAQVINCSMIALSKQERTLNLLGGRHVTVQDDTGASYPVFLAFGPYAKERAQRPTKLRANTPSLLSLQAENISKQATKVRSIDVKRIAIIDDGATEHIKMTFSNPPMRAITYHQQAAAVPAPQVIQEPILD